MPKRRSARAARERDINMGMRIRAFRIDRGMTQTDLGKELEVSFQQVQKYERGTNRLSAARLWEIAIVFDTTPHELMGWNGSGPKISKPIDVESFKLAQEFNGLRDGLKPAFRTLINTVMNEE